MFDKNNINKKLISSFCDVAECEVCNCIVFKKEENRGSSEIVEEEEVPSVDYGHIPRRMVEKIRERYYCKKHKPKS